MLKYAKDQGGYTNGRRPQDYVIFADLILPFAPRHLDIFELSEEGAVNSFKLKWVATVSEELTTINLNEEVPLTLMMISVHGFKVCQQNYVLKLAFYGRTLSLFNWWGSLL